MWSLTTLPLRVFTFLLASYASHQKGTCIKKMSKSGRKLIKDFVQVAIVCCTALQVLHVQCNWGKEQRKKEPYKSVIIYVTWPMI